MKCDDGLELPGCLFLEVLAPVNNSEFSFGHPKRRIECERSFQCCNCFLRLAHQRECNPLPARPLRALRSAPFDEPKLFERVSVALFLQEFHSPLIGCIRLLMVW